MGPKIIVILFLVLLLGLVIYFVRSGLAGDAFQGLGGMLKFPSSTVHYSAPGTPQNGGGSYYANPPPQAASSSSGTAATTTINPADIPAGFTASQLSPYFHKIRFGGVSTGAYGQITLSANLNQGDPGVDVTGWRITANRGGEYVPQAINIYDPSGLTAPSDIILRSGQYVNMYSQSGPFNLRLNECIGYIGNQNKFNPQLPGYCPTPDRSGISSFTGACQNFIYSIGACQVPNLNSAQIPLDDYACRSYIENNFSYRTCFNAHVNDAQFLSNEWRAWMGASPLDPYHDNVHLFDRNGLLVDAYSY
jgi:hypothetical protein